MARKYNLIDDGYHPELVQQALFEGHLEIPALSAPQRIIIPKSLTPFSKRKYVENYDTAICEYEHDLRFAEKEGQPWERLRVGVISIQKVPDKCQVIMQLFMPMKELINVQQESIHGLD